MNTALLILAASVAIPFAGMEARRKWRDVQRHHVLHGASPWDDFTGVLNGQPVRALRINPTVEANEPVKAGKGEGVPHGNGSYSYENRSSCGTISGPSA